VYDTQTQQWASAADTWTDTAFGFNALHVTLYNGERRVFAVDYDNALVYLLYEGIYDEMPIGTAVVPFLMETRGYTGQDPFSFKKYFRATVGVATVSPSITLTAIMDGVNEEKVLLPVITKSLTKFYTHGKADFNPATDDPNQPYREDYEIVQPPATNENVAIEDFEQLAAGTIQTLPATSLVTLLQQPIVQKQQTFERRIIRDTGRWCSIRVANTQGICEVTGVSVEGTEYAQGVKTAA
jgi:hypothetical protein